MPHAGNTPLPRIGKRNRSGSQELPENTGNETTPSEKTSQYSDKTSSSGPQPQRPLAKRIKAEIELMSTRRPTSSPYVGEVSSDASQPTYLPTPQMHPNLETSSTAEHSESSPMSSLSVDEASSGPSQPTNPPTIQMSVNIETSSAAEHFEASPTSLYVDEASSGASPPAYLPTYLETSSTAEHGEACPISSPSIDEASSGAPQSTNSPTMQMNADAEPPSTGGPAETQPVSRKRSRSPSPSEGRPFPVNIRQILAPPLPPTKWVKLQSGEAVPTQSPAYGKTPPNSDSQTRYGVPARRQKHRVPKETLMLLIRKSRHSASEAMLETQSVSESFLRPDASISRHTNSVELDNANRGEVFSDFVITDAEVCMSISFNSTAGSGVWKRSFPAYPGSRTERFYQSSSFIWPTTPGAFWYCGIGSGPCRPSWRACRDNSSACYQRRNPCRSIAFNERQPISAAC